MSKITNYYRVKIYDATEKIFTNSLDAFVQKNITANPSATLICITNNNDVAGKCIGVEYNEAFSSFNNDEIKTPYLGGNASFKDELRYFHQATSSYDGNRNDEQTHMEEKLKSAYGPNVTIYFQEITLPITPSSPPEAV